MSHPHPRAWWFCSIASVLGVLLTTGCNEHPSPSAGSASAQASVSPATSQQPAQAGRAAPADGEACLVDHSQPIRDQTESNVTDPATGKTVTRVGTPASPGAVTVKLADLLANPEQYVGRTLHVEGPVTHMCTHKRAWFALGEASGKTLRVIAAPRFLVPANAIGRLARVDGTIEMREIPDAVAKHVAEEHGQTTPIRRVPLFNASGAEFL